MEPRIHTELPIIDSHHHLFDRADDHHFGHTCRRRFLVDDYVECLGDTHNVVATVVVQARVMYRADGPEELRPVGETEFLNGQAAMSASGRYGSCRVGAGIVGFADLRLGDRVRPVLESHMAAAPARFRGIRQPALWDADPTVLGEKLGSPAGLYRSEKFRRGLAHLAALGLSFDAFVLAPQLGDIVDLARKVPQVQMVLNHLGNPVGVGVHQGLLAEEFTAWRLHMAELARCPNVTVKMGGLNSFLSGSPTYRAVPPPSAESLAAEWKPYVENAVELFGAGRCMFESNLPTDGSGAFTTILDAYLHLVTHCSEQEKREIFSGTASRVYRLRNEEPDRNDGKRKRSDGAATSG